MARRVVRPSIAELAAAGRWLSLVDFCSTYDAAYAAYLAGRAFTRAWALRLQALLYLGLAARFFAPNRPGVLRVMGLKPGCISAACRAPGCQGNHVDAAGLLHVIHDKTGVAHGPRPPLLCAPPLLQLLADWLAWGRAELLGDAEDTGALFLYPSTSSAMTEAQSSAYLPAAIRLISGASIHITHTSVRPACPQPRTLA